MGDKFVEFGLQNPREDFEAADGIIAEFTSRQSYFVMGS
jgi:hypothetical protein